MNGQAGWAKTGRNASARPAHTEWARPAGKPLARHFPPDGIAERYARPLAARVAAPRRTGFVCQEISKQEQIKGPEMPIRANCTKTSCYEERSELKGGQMGDAAHPATRRRLRGGPGCRCQRSRRCLRRQSHSPSFAGSRSSRRSTLPTGDLGRLARNSMREGRL